MADPLQALNRIIQSQQERERFDVQTSLQMMQYAQQKRMQDIQVAGETLKLAQAANEQMKLTVASQFLSESGLGQYYLGGTGDEKIENLEKSAELLVEKGFSPTDASRITTALWSYNEAKDPNQVIGIAAGLGTIMDKVDKTKDEEHTFSQFFKAMGGKIDKETGAFSLRKSAQTVMRQASKVQSNDFNISQEIMQFSQGDYEVQSEIGLYKDVPLPGGDLADIFEPFDMTVDYVADAVTGKEIGPGMVSAALFTTYAAGAIAHEQLGPYAKENLRIYRSVTTRLNNQLARDIKNLPYKKFIKKYGDMVGQKGFNKKFAQSKAGQKLLAQVIRSKGRLATPLMKMGQSALKTKYISAIWGAGKTAVKAGGGKWPSMAAPWMYRSIGGMVGGETGEAIGQTVGVAQMMKGNQIINKTGKALRLGKKSFFKFAIKRLGITAGKMATAAMADSPVLPFGDFVALGIGAWEIAGLWREWNDVYLNE